MCVWSLRRGRPHEAAAIALDEQQKGHMKGLMKSFFMKAYCYEILPKRMVSWIYNKLDLKHL